MVPSDIYILHLNATKKVNQCEYPELVVDISNRMVRVVRYAMADGDKPQCNGHIAALPHNPAY
ncbi:hypothetical protein F441_17517 [Phytophthora nicotianae CJ01A1]|uniref:Uncharacterized protein n=3 Tax=Phytophthora nicotianae TaxID=4792 RepID=W2I8W6_PHYNI|nr:hypothetical protein L915_17183 [Phytophthora nicotianae]ETL29838.1 hypothetical protein L916_17079 [Phytophthora nicotianae]ETO64900.1 hypothetical protein F444_17689 [Phytophthora nicotianae P1976]ETP05999.1 hypothetical protein F441_17517 [Phytophthora nicotianae CJ01A1]